MALFRQLHDQVRAVIQDLTDEDLNWLPLPGANSIAVTITHLVGSEAESFRVAAGMPSRRDRDAEFHSGEATATDILTLLNQADALLAEAAPKLEQRLWDCVPLPTLPDDEHRPAITWVVGNYGHAREHVGHIQFTRDLRRATAG